MLKRNIFKKTKKKGQSTVEYILLVAAIIGLLVMFLGPGGVFRTAYNSALGYGTTGMENMALRLMNSRPLSP